MTAALSLSPLASRVIGLYQRYLSPRKGFRCAYGVLHGRDSCSRFARRAIDRCGVGTGVKLTRRRFERCRTAGLVLEYDQATRRRRRGERWQGCVNGWTPGCGDADAACCAGEVAVEGCSELPGACH